MQRQGAAGWPNRGLERERQHGGHHQHQQRQNAATQQQQQDENIAEMLQAQEYHRAQYPSRIVQDRRGVHSSAQAALQAIVAGRGHSGTSGDPAREARHRMRDRQLEMAMEVNPEAFVSVPMLYVQVELNNVPVKAFVDTGAQMTVMNVNCAQRVGLLSAVDPRFKGIATGVGMARIAGRVHMATLRLGKTTAVDTSITVLEQGSGPELLLGLDVMRKYQANIDLGRNALIIGGAVLPFVKGDTK